MSLQPSDDGSVIEAPEMVGERRAFHTSAEDRDLIFKAAYQEIATANPRKLVAIAARASALCVQARLSGDPALERSATEIRTRAERRLAWFKRQPQN
jgi:hypothetical protein